MNICMNKYYLIHHTNFNAQVALHNVKRVNINTHFDDTA